MKIHPKKLLPWEIELVSPIQDVDLRSAFQDGKASL